MREGQRKNSDNWTKTRGPNGGIGYKLKAPKVAAVTFRNWEGRDYKSDDGFPSDDFGPDMVNTSRFTTFTADTDAAPEDVLGIAIHFGSELGADMDKAHDLLWDGEEGLAAELIGKTFIEHGYDIKLDAENKAVSLRKQVDSAEKLPVPEMPWEEARNRKLVLSSHWSVSLDIQSEPAVPEAKIHMSAYVEDEPNEFGGHGVIIDHDLSKQVFPDQESARRFQYENGLLKLYEPQTR